MHLTKIILVGLSSFFLPIMWLMIGVGMLIIIDMIMGIAAAKKCEEKVTSKLMGRTITKMLIYQIFLISSNVLETIFFSAIPITKISATIFATYEFYSIGEKFYKYTGLNIIKYLRNILDSKLGRDIKKEEIKED